MWVLIWCRYSLFYWRNENKWLISASFPASLVAQMVKSLPAMWKTWVWFLGREDPLEKEMATYSSILAWRIPWTEEPGRLQSMASKESDRTKQLTLSVPPSSTETTIRKWAALILADHMSWICPGLCLELNMLGHKSHLFYFLVVWYWPSNVTSLNFMIFNCWKVITAGRNAKWHSHFGRQFGTVSQS